MAVRNIVRAAAQVGQASQTAAPVRVDSTTGSLFINGTAAGTTETEVVPDAQFATISGDGAIPLTPGTTYLTKGSAAAITLAAPGTGMIGKKITVLTGSDFAHVVTFTGTTLQDGTAGANTTWTATAVQGCSITVIGVTATKWNVVSFNLGTIAP